MPTDTRFIPLTMHQHRAETRRLLRALAAQRRFARRFLGAFHRDLTDTEQSDLTDIDVVLTAVIEAGRPLLTTTDEDKHA